MNLLTDKEQEAFDVYEKVGSQRKAAKLLNISRRTFRNRFEKAKNKIYNTPVGFKTTKIATNSDGTITAMQHKLSPEITDTKDGEVIKTSTLYGADGSITGQWVMRKPIEEQKNDYLEALDNHFVNNVKPFESPYIKKEYDLGYDYLSLFMSIDEHIGVKLIKDEVGQDYNLDDAVNLMTDKFAELLKRTPRTRSCLYVNLGDQFHANDHMDVTPASKHPLHSSSSFNNISDAVVKLNRNRVQMLREHYENVYLRGVAGNHDYDPMGWLFRCYDIAFEQDETVDVEFWSDELGVFQWGNTMLGFHHGHKLKPDVMAGACADRYPQMYGSTNMRYLHTGHYHNDSSKDIWGGFKWHCHRTMSPKDKFSYQNGYLSRQSMKSYLYNSREGEVANFTTSLI